jgi:hypothetical protein
VWPEIPKESIGKQASAAGFAAFLLLAGAIYLTDKLLAHLFGAEWSELLLAAPAFLACLVVEPVRWRVENWLIVRHCMRHGGHTFVQSRHAESLRQCARCGSLDMEHWKRTKQTK